MMLGSMDSALPPKSDRNSLRRPLRKLSLGNDPLPASPLISGRNLCPGLSESVVQLDRLGKGATSNVFLAVHAATLKMVALKEVNVSNDADRRAVRTEMRALKTQRSPLLNSAFTTELASCPRIVDYYGSVVRENGNACIAVEYVAGGSLENWLENSGGSACPEPWFAHIAYQALEALDFVHTGGRVHRDVKPANLLITRNGDLKLGDFGAAGVENSWRMIGTQRFMAPERLKGHRATAQSDLWSFGLSLATAALGDDFIIQGTTQFMQLDIANDVKKTLSKTTTLSDELRDFLTLCLSKNPARRPTLRALMMHRFLEQRHDWQAKCPEVVVAVRGRKRQRLQESRDPYTMTTGEILDALCRVRAEENLVDSSFDPATAADLAYELDVTPEFLVRDLHRRTLEFIKERDTGSSVGGESVGGVSISSGLSGVSDSGGENENEDQVVSGQRSRRGGTGNGDGGGGIGDDYRRGIAAASSAARRRRRTSAAGSDGAREGRPYSSSSSSGRGRQDGSHSPPPPPGPAAIADGQQVAMDVVTTTPSVGGGMGDRSGNTVYPPVTPRNRPTTGYPNGACGFGGAHQSASSKRSRRRAMEMTSAVKLTPHKRRGEKKASQTKRNGSYCAADARRSGRRRERERHMTASTEPENPMPVPVSGSPQESSTAAVATAEARGAVETATVAEAVAAAPSARGHSSQGGATSNTSAAAVSSGSSSAAGVSGGGGGTARQEGGCHSAECRRSLERKSKRDSKPRTAASRTLPSRNDVRMRSMRAMSRLADEMKAEIKVRDRVHRFRVYPKCFSGREAVQWMLDGSHASSVDEAEKIGNEMMKASVFQHILNSHLFEDSSVYYQFTDGETPPPPSRGSRRLRQIARVVGGNVARRLVHGGGRAAGVPATADVNGGSGSGGRPASGLAAGAGNVQAAGVGEGNSCTCCEAGKRNSFTRDGIARRQQQQQPLPKLAERSNLNRRSRGRGANTNTTSQLRRFSSSVSTLTVPETPY
eukprot:g6229.t1